jgi:GMP synthase-like glutamine amidotransferase
MAEESLQDTVLVLQHQNDAGPGNLASWLDGRGMAWQLVDVSAQPLPPVVPRRALVVLGSRESVYDDTVPWLAAETAFVEATIATGTPVLGLCFGAQLLASVLGGTVSRAPNAERGWIDVIATPQAVGPAACESEEAALAGQWFAWHQDHIQPPPGSVVLARSDRCVQGFSAGRHLGVQFHPEVTLDQVGSWLAQDRRRRQLHQADGDAEQLLHATRRLEPHAASAAAQLYQAFFRS